MGLSLATIENVQVIPDGPDMFVSWDSNGPPGEIFQVYVNRRLAWTGQARRCVVPAGRTGVNTWVEVGTVPALESQVDHADTLATMAPRADSALLRWEGGTYLDPSGRDDVQGFRIHRSPSPGTSVNFDAAVADVPAYPLGVVVDGFGKGPFGSAGFGRAGSSYSWQSPPLAAGTWQFAVVPHGRSGAVPGITPLTASVTIAAPPRPPARDAGGARLTFAYDGPPSRTGTLQWLASPSN